MFFGEIVPTVKAVAWPYFVFVADRDEGAAKNVGERVTEYTDNQYGFAFQFPSDWKFLKPPPPENASETRALLQSPWKSHVMALVSRFGNSFTKEQFENNPRRGEILADLIELTLDQIYKKTSRDIGASSVIVRDKRALPSDEGVKFQISTGHVVKTGGMIVVAGTHAIPYGKDYMVSFVMVHPLNPKATVEIETMDRVFTSFHLVGERPR